MRAAGVVLGSDHDGLERYVRPGRRAGSGCGTSVAARLVVLMATGVPNGRLRRIWGRVWSVFAWFALLRASGVQWSVMPDSIPHVIRITAAYAVVIPVMAYAITLLGKRLRIVPAVAVLDVYIVAVACLHGGSGKVPTLSDVGWSFAGVAIGAILAAALESTSPTKVRR